MEVPSKPRSAKRLRPISRSCSRRCLPVIRTRLGVARGRSVTPSTTDPPCTYRSRRDQRLLAAVVVDPLGLDALGARPPDVPCPTGLLEHPDEPSGSDRKSTRLNSSHVKTSYAVFCLTKKTQA